MNNKKTNEDEVIINKSKTNLIFETIICFCFMCAVSILAPILYLINPLKLNLGEVIQITYSENMFFNIDKSVLKYSLISGIFDISIFSALVMLFSPSGLKPIFKKKNIISYIILSVFGFLAFVVIASLCSSFIQNKPYIALFMAGFLTDIYQYLIYKLYFENRSESNFIIWEIFRFAIVGLVAAVFDFLTCYFIQFICLKGNQAMFVTLISTACGFVIGVIINYLMSTYMVYKASKSGFSKSFKGIIIFVLLSAIGLGIGMLIQAFLYDFLFLKKEIKIFSYPVDFVIRTLIVMVYNYISRKLIIYRK